MHAQGHPNLKPSNGRVSKLDDPEFVRYICELYAAGLGREQMIDKMVEDGYPAFNKHTLSKWRKDPRVRAMTAKLSEERAQRVSAKIDYAVEARLQEAVAQMSIKDLMMIRKEYGGTSLGRKEVADDNVVVDALKTMQENPNFQEELDKLFGATEAAETE